MGGNPPWEFMARFYGGCPSMGCAPLWEVPFYEKCSLTGTELLLYGRHYWYPLWECVLKYIIGVVSLIYIGYLVLQFSSLTQR